MLRYTGTFLLLSFILLVPLSAQDSLTRTDSSTYTLTQQRFTSAQVTFSAVRGFKNFLGVQQGIVLRDGLLRVHGGGANENSFLLNGFNLTTVSGQPAIYLIPEALSGIAIHAGNFSATQNALGTSLIATRLKTGGPDLQIKASLQTDKFARTGETFLDTYSYREHSFVLQAGGSVTEHFRYYMALENQDVGDTRKVFNKGITFYNLKQNPYDPNSETFDLVYPAGFTPGNSSRRWALNSFFNFDFKPFTAEITALYDYRNYSSDATPIKNIFNTRDFTNKNNTLFLGLNMTYELNKTSAIRARFGYYDQNRDKFDEYLGNNWKAWADSAAVVPASGGDIEFRNRWYLAYGASYYRYGFIPNGYYGRYNKSNTGWLEGGLDFNTTLWDRHKVSLGGDWRDMTLRYFNINPHIMRYTHNWFAPGKIPIDDIPKYFFASYAGNISGYDRSGNITDGGEFPAKRITHTAAYFNYSYAYDSFQIEAGLRYNYFDNKNVLDPFYDPFYQTFIPEGVGDKKLESWDPRLSFSYVADRDILLNISSGIYTVSPVVLWKKYNFDEYYYAFGNEVNANFNQASQLQQFSYFDLTVKSVLGRTGALYGNFFWKKEFREWRDDRLAPNIRNRMPTEIKGLDLTFSFFSSASFSPKIQYSYYQAKRPDAIIGAPEDPFNSGQAILPLENSQSIRANLEYRIEESGNRAGGQTRMNVIFRYDNGQPYLHPVLYPSYISLSNSLTTPWTSYVDARLDRSWTLGSGVDLNFFIRVNNLFNVKNILNVFPETGTATENHDMEWYKQKYPREFLDFYRQVAIESGEAYRSVYGREVYGSPRQIFFGLEVSY